MEFGVNFIISGVIYVLLREIGFNFLEDIQLGFISAMTIIVFLLKTLLI